MKGLCLAAAGVCIAVVGFQDFDGALAKPAPTKSLSMQVANGGKVFQQWCVECHNARGFGTVSLEKRYQGAVPAILDQREDLSDETVRYIVRNGISFMPPFRKTEITDQQLAALSTYLTSDPKIRPRSR